ncbi:mechanosensitive ion channel protein MscS [Pleomorphomonas diazotrophica]|uniref:Mechanosensitive ion channel protein MscS n=2 Tax=Pleomorphomonas diazotrophica TaxID=1166257 RepID=A0A1I4RK37_9HYPH|nr:mechanosensitive ion channel protein MscS [Pleomorphomonas diazotrophica]SFM52608.1 small conductance mechanosensitive channel [Pleomorphomonas diazotrophica]
MMRTMPILRLLALVLALVLPAAASAQTAPAVPSLPQLTAPAQPATPGSTAPASTPSPEAAKALADILKDDAARAALIGELERLAQPVAAGNPAAPADAASTEPADASAVPLAREIGSVTQDLSRQVVDVVLKIGRGLGNLARLFDGSAAVNWEGVREQGLALLILVVFAFATLNIARFIARWPLGAVERVAKDKPLPRRVLWSGLALLIDWAVIGFAWFATSAYAIAASGGGRIDLMQSLFIDAFVVIEFLKSCLAAVLQHRRPSLRVFNLEPTTARFWYLWLSRLISFLGYGVLVAHPLVNKAIGFSVGIGFRLAVVLLTLIGATLLVTFKRDEVRNGLFPLLEPVRSTVLRTILALLIHGWHVIVIVYLAVAFVLWVSRPFDAVDYMAWATVETVFAIIIGGIVDSLLSHAISGGIRLPADVKKTLPLLEARLNMMVPLFFRAVRMLLVAVVAAVLLQSWGVIDLIAWFQSDGGTEAVGRILSAAIIVLAAGGIWLAASSWVEYRLNPSLGRITNARTRTLLSLFRNAFSIVLVIIAAMLTLSQLGVDIAPLVAGAGVVGLAVGFGSQKLVQDIITGAFIQFENAMNEGDVVTVAGLTGAVDRLTIRSVGIRDADGVYHIIPFSSVTSVSNAMRGFAFATASVNVAYATDLDEAKSAMREAFDRLMEGPKGAVILEPLDIWGVVSFTAAGVVMKARIKTLPGEQWGIGRLYNEQVKKVFDERGITSSF